jgi:hypothetical protein
MLTELSTLTREGVCANAVVASRNEATTARMILRTE